MLDGLKALITRKDMDWHRHLQEAEKAAMFTPDLDELQGLKQVNIFLYNECQRGQPAHDKLGTNLFGGAAYTESSDFVMYKKELGKETFPFAMEVREDQKMGLSSLIGDPGQIMGEVFTVKSMSVKDLDEYMLNGVYYERKKVWVCIPFKTSTTQDTWDIQRIEVYMWIGREEFWKEQIHDPETKKLITQSKRLFGVKENTHGAFYTFDWNVEAHRE